MKAIEFALSMLVTVLAVSVGFGCALAIATVWLRSMMNAMMSALTRTTYNVSSVPDSCAFLAAVGIDTRVESDVR